MLDPKSTIVAVVLVIILIGLFLFKRKQFFNLLLALMELAEDKFGQIMEK